MKGRLKLANKVGILGEDLACRFLMKRGYVIIARNYLKPWGEIDIVAEKGKKLYFYEVKAVTHVTRSKVSGETSHRPEENVHPYKIAKLRRVIETYLLERAPESQEWEFGVITAKISEKERTARIELIPDIVL